MDLLTIIKMDPDNWSFLTKNESLGSEVLHHPDVAGGVAGVAEGVVYSAKSLFFVNSYCLRKLGHAFNV